MKTKQEILTALAHSGDDKLLLAGLLDKEQTCEQRGYLTHTKFLDLMDIEKLIESAEHCDLGDCANCPSCGRVCCKERTMGELAREVKRLQAENEKLRDELKAVREEVQQFAGR